MGTHKPELLRRRIKVFTRPLRHRLAWGALKMLALALGVLPLTWAQALGRGLGRCVGFCVRAESRAMAQRIAVAALAHRPSAGDCWADLGQRLVELLVHPKVLPHVDVDPAAKRCLDEALAEGRGLVVATGHLGHWELMAAALAREGYTVHSTAARRRTGPVHRWLEETRAALQVSTHTPGGGARGVMRILKAGGAMGIFVDQNTGERGTEVSFLGHLAPTPLTCGRLVCRSDTALCVVWNLRHGKGYRVYALPVATSVNTTPERVAQETSDILAAQIAKCPEQWVWQHDRWGRVIDDPPGSRK
ncbi:MAG: lysophospholipid acyltransferase family protein [Bradymonadia bacterium]